jgi:signal transduction histidine kinase
MLCDPSRLLFGVLLASAWAHAAAPSAGLASEYVLKIWETDDGLPHNAITTAVQRRDGYLWVATQGGLVRFDGLQFVPFESELITGPKSAKVAALIEEDADTLLLGTGQSGFLRLRGNQLSVHPLTAQLKPKHVIAHLFREAPNMFWVVFADREAWRWDHGNVEKFPPPTGARVGMWPATFARDDQGHVFLARGAGIERYAGGTLTLIDKSPMSSLAIASAAREGVWVAVSHRLAKLRDGQLVTIASPAPWTGPLPPPVMFEDRTGVLWLAANDGLVRWQDGVATNIATSHIKVVDLRDDDEGNLWIATGGGGLNRLQRTRLALVADEPNWTDNPAGTVCEDAAGNIWFANRKGVRKLSGAHIETLGTEQGWPRRTLVVAPDNAGQLWFAAAGDLYRAPTDGSRPPTLVQPADSGAIHAIRVTRDGSVWVGGNIPVLRRYRGDAVESYCAAQGFTSKYVRSIGDDAAGHVWIGDEHGLIFEWADGTIVEHHDVVPNQVSAVRAIHGDADGNVWFGTAGGGVLLRRRGKFSRIAAAQGLPDDVISQILEDDSGWLWFGSRRGIFKVRKSDLLACAAGNYATITPVSYGRADGLSGISAVGSYQPTAWKTRAGQLWFLTRRGLVTTDPARHENEDRLPRVYLDQVSADGHALDLAAARVKSSVRKIEFQFTAPTFVAPERVRFRYQLQGFDVDWVDAGTRRFATYPALRPGRYVFHVSASNGDLAWNPTGASLGFEVLPMWWETWWARALALALSVSLVVVLVRYWSHRRLRARLARLEQEQRVEQERVRIARDLHDDLGASLTHVSMMAEELAEDWTDLSDPQERSHELAARVRTIARDLDAVVWTVSPKNDSLASLAAYICHFAAEYFRRTSIDCLAHAAEDIPAVPLTPEVRHHLFLIAKELLNNVLKHSHARHVDVRMQMAAGIFELTVADDGRGFSLDEAAQSGRNGLGNLRARAAEAGGTLDFMSTAQGTVATLQFRVAGRARPAATAAAAAAPSDLPENTQQQAARATV